MVSYFHTPRSWRATTPMYHTGDIESMCLTIKDKTIFGPSFYIQTGEIWCVFGLTGDLTIGVQTWFSNFIESQHANWPFAWVTYWMKLLWSAFYIFYQVTYIFSATETRLSKLISDVLMGAMASQITSLARVYSTVHSGTDQRKHQSSASLLLVRENHR